MKKNPVVLLITLILNMFFLVSCSTDEGNTNSNIYLEIPDASFEAILIELGIDSDGEINKQMLKADANTIGELDLATLAHGAISDMSGIEGFVSLKKLSAYQHNIEQIDLSFNVLLDSVYLAGNYISSIDVSNNINLELLDLSANNLVSVEGVTNLKKLKTLNLSFNYLEEISINNPLLKILHISHNDLTSINITDAINLKNLLLTTNKLQNLDVSANLNLETLLVSDNQLESINLTENSSLTHLYITSNLLTNLDVSSNINLVDLKVDRNPNLSCIKINSGHNIPMVSLAAYQELNASCN
ncbi:leucine-rich repeat domain-containing protein [Marixanthotalea marina]|uniref:hypothetical protein n=1 Tax=Marixanthotalea marina TaxID=2844359 RepID=UPI002989CDE3|nr:hypothetical protein [Marixanthotalea marina]